MSRWQRPEPLSPSTPYRKIVLKVFAIGNEKVLHTRAHVAKQGQVFNENGVDRLLSEMADILDKELPNQQFRLVELSGGRFNFVNETKPEEPDPNERVLFRTNALLETQPEHPESGGELDEETKGDSPAQGGEEAAPQNPGEA